MQLLLWGAVNKRRASCIHNAYLIFSLSAHFQNVCFLSALKRDMRGITFCYNNFANVAYAVEYPYHGKFGAADRQQGRAKG